MTLSDKLPPTEIRMNNKRMSEVICDEITNWIMDGTLGVGQRIREEDLAEVFGVSRMPVREAIRMLESRGLVDTIPYVGSSVKKLSSEEIDEIYLLRTILEPLACELASERITEEEIDVLEGIQEKLENLCLQPKNLENSKALYFANRDFHIGIYSASGLEKLLSIINNLWDSIAYLRIRTAFSENYPQQMIREHREYLKLLRSRDGKELASQLKENLRLHADTYIKNGRYKINRSHD